MMMVRMNIPTVALMVGCKMAGIGGAQTGLNGKLAHGRVMSMHHRLHGRRRSLTSFQTTSQVFFSFSVQGLMPESAPMCLLQFVVSSQSPLWRER